MAFENKFSVHKYKDEIIKKFEEDVSIRDMMAWLESLGEEYKLSKDTLMRHKKRHIEALEVDKEIKKVEKDLGEPDGDAEVYLLETIAQCRTRKRAGVSGKDFQYYDQQMQSAIKLLTEIRGTTENKMGLDEVFEKIAESINNDAKKESNNTSTVQEGVDNKVS